MHEFYQSYVKVSERTKWFGILLGIALWVVLLLEIADMIHRLIGNGEFFWQIFRIEISFLLVFPVICLTTFRIMALLDSTGARRNQASTCWFGLLVLLFLGIAYSYIDSLTYGNPGPECVPDGKNICFGVYDMRRGPVWPLALLVYLTLGIIGIFVKGIFVYLQIRSLRLSNAKVKAPF